MTFGGKPTERGESRATVEYVLLGLLAIQPSGEIHGYDLGRALSDGVIGQIVRVEPGMLYHYLKRLSRDGLLSTRVEAQVGRPDRQLHSLTAEGWNSLSTWLAAPVRSTREIRLEFLIKLYLSRQLDPSQARRLVFEQLNVMSARSQRLEAQIQATYPSTPDYVFGETILQLREGQTRAALEWLNSLPEASDSSESGNE
ncbi:MAG TPA: PadR family transcriptional regulator [Thermomicrobiales bacterium]|nr:PadR family transcriptional regulator [Thermomicrobiales bacterium]